MDVTQQVAVLVVLEMELLQLRMEQALTVQQVILALLFPLLLAQLTVVAVAVEIAIHFHLRQAAVGLAEPVVMAAAVLVALKATEMQEVILVAVVAVAAVMVLMQMDQMLELVALVSMGLLQLVTLQI
jgi:hypothetical protein